LLTAAASDPTCVLPPPRSPGAAGWTLVIDTADPDLAESGRPAGARIQVAASSLMLLQRTIPT
jgi:hypothetical protein